MMHSCTAPGARPARARAAWMAAAPSCVAGSAASAPWKPPKGVRAALTMHTSARTRPCLLTTAPPHVPACQAAARRGCRRTWPFRQQSAAVAECRTYARSQLTSHVVTVARQVPSTFTTEELQQECCVAQVTSKQAWAHTALVCHHCLHRLHTTAAQATPSTNQQAVTRSACTCALS